MKKQLLVLCTLLAICSADALSRRKKFQLAQSDISEEIADQQNAQEAPDLQAVPEEPSIEQQENEVPEQEQTEAPSNDEASVSAPEEGVPSEPETMDRGEQQAIIDKEQAASNAMAKPEATAPVKEKSSTLEDIKKIVQGGQPFRPSPEFTFDIQSKKKDVIKLVEHAAQTLRDKPFDEACNLFSHTKEFVHGELYIFVYDMSGTCLAHGENPELIWRNLIDLKDWVGTPIVKDIIKTARTNGGWTTYGWNNSTKISYVLPVQKGNITYAIGSGFYPQSKEEAVINLVKGGVALFNQIKQAGEPIDWAFSRLSYPRGQFVSGNLYLYALDFKGTIMAQGDRPGLINTNSWNAKDAKGKYINREIITKLKAAGDSGVWVDYISKRALKKSYAEAVTGPDGKQYFIACGYYPEANREQVEELVHKGYQFMKGQGKTAAIEEFSSRRSDDYRYGDLYLVVYDLKGTVITHGANPDQIGANDMQAKDEDGHYYVKDIIESATKTGTWTNAKVKGAFQSTFAMRIDLGVETFVMLSSYYPISKPESMTLLVQSAENYLKDNSREKAFAQFVLPTGSFRRGDLQIFVLSQEGLCYAYGDDYDLIWRNIIKLQDDDGRPFVKLLINVAQNGPNFIKAKLNKADKIIYATPVDKGGVKYIIGSGYYR